MTYFGFLALFLGIPIVILSLVTVRDYLRGRWLPDSFRTYPAWIVMAVLCVVAFVYTTPWDNYLVATGVWWYDIDLVSGIVFGWVPIEEYTFFIVQPIMTSLFFLLVCRHVPAVQEPVQDNAVRQRATVVAFILWLASTAILIGTFVVDTLKPMTYLTLELSWALIPITIQMAFGADILWRYRRTVAISIGVTTLYLSTADAIAIGSGTWTIDPAQSLNVYLGGVLPVEEFIFFLITNTLVVFGMTLVLAVESQARAHDLERFTLLRSLFKRIRTDHKPPVSPDAI